MTGYCPSCLPTKRRSHFDLHADYYFEKIRKVFFAPFGFLDPKRWENPDLVWTGILHLLNLLGAVEFVGEPDESQIFNRSLIVFREAQKRGIEIEAIKIFGQFKNEFRYNLGGEWHYFETNPLASVWKNKPIDEKFYTKCALAKNQVPVPEGSLATSFRIALRYGVNLGFPLAIKPNAGSLGHHGTYPVNDEGGLIKALRLAFQYRPDVIVEKFLYGTNYRATVIGREHVFVAEKQIASVLGDGKSTILELINSRNSDPRRGNIGEKNFTLFKIPPLPIGEPRQGGGKEKESPPLKGEGKGGVNQDITAKLTSHLFNQNLTPYSVPPPGQKIILFKDFVPGAVDAFDVTSKTHADNLEIFRRAANALDADIVGFDLIAEDITKPAGQQTFGILEANSVPYIDLHAFPTAGPAAPVAKLVWDTILKRLEAS